MAKKSKNVPDFETALKTLETIIDKMEHQSLSLEESLALFEEGVRLTQICQKALANAEQKIAYITEHTS